jgi:hypothetical protein
MVSEAEVRELNIRVLESKGFFDVEELECDLDNPIHPLFSQDKWRGIDEGLYANMKPALQLASLWITDDRVLDWYYHNTVGIVKRSHADDKKPYLAPNPKYEMKTDSGKAIVRRLWFEKLKKLGKVLVFHLVEKENVLIDDLGQETESMCFWSPADAMNKVEGREKPRWSLEELGLKTTSDGFTRTYQEKVEPQIVIGNMYKAFLTGIPPNADGLGRMQKFELFNFWFKLANTICHAVGHFPRFRWYDHNYGTKTVEPAHDVAELEFLRNTKSNPESGRSWERYLFGNHANVFHFPDQSQSDYRLYEKVGNSLFLFLHPGLPSCRALVPAHVTVSWFRKSYWHPSRSLEELHTHSFTRFWVSVRDIGKYQVIVQAVAGASR